MNRKNMCDKGESEKGQLWKGVFENKSFMNGKI